MRAASAVALIALLPGARAPYPHHRECHSRACADAGDAAFNRRHYRRPRARALASWYDDAGSLACSRAPDGLGVASLVVPCGARVRLCHARCVTATVDDHGPYVDGRLFDLNATVKAELGCPDLCKVRWRRRY